MLKAKLDEIESQETHFKVSVVKLWLKLMIQCAGFQGARCCSVECYFPALQILEIKSINLTVFYVLETLNEKQG